MHPAWISGLASSLWAAQVHHWLGGERGNTLACVVVIEVFGSRGLAGCTVCDCGSESCFGLCVGLSSAWGCFVWKLKVLCAKLKQFFLSHVSLKDNTPVDVGGLGIFPESS